MTTEEKAKRYDEALNWMRELYPGLHGATKEDAEHFFPELRESEEERIRRTLLEYFGPDFQLDFVRGVAIKKIRDWLEKQKELPFVKDVVPGFPGLYFYDGERMHFQGNPATEENPYDFAMSQQEKQKEQKPVQTSEEKEYIRTLKSLISDFIRDKKPEDVAFYQKIYDWLEGRHIEHKHAEYLDTDNMKPRVKISGRSYGEWEPGDTGVVDGYCRGANDFPYAIVILDKNFRFVMVDPEHLELIG